MSLTRTVPCAAVVLATSVLARAQQQQPPPPPLPAPAVTIYVVPSYTPPPPPPRREPVHWSLTTKAAAGWTRQSFFGRMFDGTTIDVGLGASRGKSAPFVDFLGHLSLSYSKTRHSLDLLQILLRGGVQYRTTWCALGGGVRFGRLSVGNRVANVDSWLLGLEAWLALEPFRTAGGHAPFIEMRLFADTAMRSLSFSENNPGFTLSVGFRW